MLFHSIELVGSSYAVRKCKCIRLHPRDAARRVQRSILRGCTYVYISQQQNQASHVATLDLTMKLISLLLILVCQSKLFRSLMPLG